MSRARRNEWWFRGQGNHAWSLTATLDRETVFQDVGKREDHQKDLLREFRSEAIRVGTSEGSISEPNRLELLARHHGLPSPLMDWTLSPYVGSYFAYSSQSRDASYVSVWCMDLSLIEWEMSDELTMVSDDLTVFGNRRALQQRSVFLRVTSTQPVEVLVPGALRRFDLPVQDSAIALQDLDEMLVNASTMFYDLEGAATTARLRIGRSS